MHILTFQKGFEALESKFEPFERDLKQSNANPNHYLKRIRSIQLQIRTIQKVFEAFECKFEPFQKDFKTFVCKFEPLEKGFERLECNFEPLERDLKHSNANCYYSKQIRSIQI